MNKQGKGPGGGPVELNGGYFQVPDLVFDLPLTANEKLVLIYFMRRADRAGRSFPSVERICRDCGFGSKNTALRAINSLVESGLVRREPIPGRSHNYFVSRELCRVIEEAKKRNRKNEIASPAARNDSTGEPDLSLRGTVLSERKNRSLSADCNEVNYLSANRDEFSERGNLMKKSNDITSPFSVVTDTEGRVNKMTPTCSEYEHPCSDNEQPGVQNMNTKEYTVEGSTEKEYTVKKETRKNIKRTNEEARASSSLSPALDDSDDGNVTLLDAAEHMHTLTPQERKEFDREAQKLCKPGEPDPSESLWQRRLLRVRYLRRMREGGGVREKG